MSNTVRKTPLEKIKFIAEVCEDSSVIKKKIKRVKKKDAVALTVDGAVHTYAETAGGFVSANPKTKKAYKRWTARGERREKLKDIHFEETDI